MDAEKEARERCIAEWANVNDPPCHPDDEDWRPCSLCSKPKDTRLSQILRDALAAAEKEPSTCPPHKWSNDGETCVKCGDKDWM